MSAWLATIRETFDIWISSRDADDPSASAFASGESTLARISFELSRNSISISIKWFYSESNAATRRCRWPNQQQRQQRTNTFESDAPIPAHNSRRLLVWVNQRAASREESERASTTAIPHLCVCVCVSVAAAAAPSTDHWVQTGAQTATPEVAPGGGCVHWLNSVLNSAKFIESSPMIGYSLKKARTTPFKTKSCTYDTI